jgi:hypothetical protein
MKRADRSDECRKINFTVEVAFGNALLKIYFNHPYGLPLGALPFRCGLTSVVTRA